MTATTDHDQVPYVINPEAIGDPDQTPQVALPGWEPPCSDCMTWDAQLMFNGTWAAIEPCDRHRGEPIDGLPGLSIAPSVTTGVLGIRHDTSGLMVIPIPVDDSAEAARVVDTVRPHLAPVDWTVDGTTLLDSEVALDAYKAARDAARVAVERIA